MGKLLKTQDVLLLGLSGAIDIFNDLKDPLGILGKSYQNMYGWVPDRFKKTNCYQTVFHSLRTGYIEKVIVEGKPYLRLTSKGSEKLKRNFSIFHFQEKKWDKKWRVVIFDIEEKSRKQRDLLRIKLRELGFGMIQESVWVSPYDVAQDFREFIESHGLDNNVFVMEVSQLLAGDVKSLASKIWLLNAINNKYISLFEHITNTHDREKMSNVYMKEYVEILREDPCLPKELLPEDWYGERVKKLLKNK